MEKQRKESEEKGKWTLERMKWECRKGNWT
jgi:hypothetical protein